jgi:predicted small lipoprotein YifL
MKHTSPMMAAALAALTLAACGGGGGSAPPVADNIVPSEAQGSVNGLIAWMIAKAVTRGESAEPLDVANATLPVSEDIEPDGSF